MGKLNFYTVDKEYLEFLRKFEPKVPKQNYDTHMKFFCGTVLAVNGIKYFAPISHTVESYKTTMPIIHNGQKKASLRFSYMIPVLDKHISYMDFAKELTEEILQEKYLKKCNNDKEKAKEEAKKYIALLNIEYEFCNKNVSDIEAKALEVYEIGCNKKHYLNKNCCDFKKLEGVMCLYESRDSIIIKEKEIAIEIDKLNEPTNK